MMSSYEFEQPLDLRLKALNLSLGTYQRHMIPTNNIGTIGSSCSSNSSSSSISSSSSASGCFCNSGSCTSINGRSACIRSPGSSSNQLNLKQNQNILSPAPPFNPNQNHQLPPISHNHMINNNNNQPQPYNQMQNSASSGQHLQNQTHLRSTNIHCQPLNHHQPHPLSRLHPPPSHLQPQTSHSLKQPSMAQVTPPPPVSHQQPPPQQASSQHHYHHHPSPMPPMKSLSLSSHLMNSSFPQSLTPPGTTNQQHLIQPHNGNNVSCTNQMTNTKIAQQQQQQQSFGNDIPHQQLIKLGAVVGQSNSNNGHYMHQPDQNNSTTPSYNNIAQIQPSAAINNNQQPITASPITRQHSLVSRYNCQPCGIGFSLPENLRAHQEGYCTKRDRSQTTQVRSQSAVSPAALQQQQQQQQQLQQASSDCGNK